MSAAPSQCLAFGHRTLSGLRQSLSADIRRYLTKSAHDLARGDNWKTRLSACLTPEVFPVALYRVAHYLHACNWPRAAIFITRCNHLLNKVYITPQSCIGPGFRLPHPAGVTFHGRAGTDLTIYSLGICCPAPEGWDGDAGTGPTLGSRVTIAGHAVVHGTATVGDGSTVAHGIQLDRDAPPRVVVSSRLLRVAFRSRT